MNATDNFKKVLNYAILGMAHEARAAQERIVLREAFGEDAVTFPAMHNPLRSQIRPLWEDKERLNQLTDLMKRCKEAVNAISDKETEAFSKWFKDSQTNKTNVK